MMLRCDAATRHDYQHGMITRLASGQRQRWAKIFQSKSIVARRPGDYACRERRRSYYRYADFIFACVRPLRRVSARYCYRWCAEYRPISHDRGGFATLYCQRRSTAACCASHDEQASTDAEGDEDSRQAHRDFFAAPLAASSLPRAEHGFAFFLATWPGRPSTARLPLRGDDAHAAIAPAPGKTMLTRLAPF